MPDPTESTLRFTNDTDLLNEAKDRDLLAAGPWQEGEPAETKTCLVEIYDTDHEGSYFRVATYNSMERGEWLMCGESSSDDVVRYAPIHT